MHVIQSMIYLSGSYLNVMCACLYIVAITPCIGEGHALYTYSYCITGEDGFVTLVWVGQSRNVLKQLGERPASRFLGSLFGKISGKMSDTVPFGAGWYFFPF